MNIRIYKHPEDKFPLYFTDLEGWIVGFLIIIDPTVFAGDEIQDNKLYIHLKPCPEGVYPVMVQLTTMRGDTMYVNEWDGTIEALVS